MTSKLELLRTELKMRSDMPVNIFNFKDNFFYLTEDDGDQSSKERVCIAFGLDGIESNRYATVVSDALDQYKKETDSGAAE